MPDDIHLQQVTSRPLVVVRRRAPLQELPKVVPDGCGRVWGFIKSYKIGGTGRNVAVYLDDEINLEVGVEVAVPYPGGGELIASTTPGGQAAMAVHLGPYQKLPETHRALRDWCQRQGYALAGPNWEIYDHWKDEWNADPTQIRTEVFYLLKTERPDRVAEGAAALAARA